MSKLSVAVVIDIFHEVNPAVIVKETDADKTFKEIGFDSLDIVSAFLNIEERYSVQIPDDEVPRLSTINKVLGFVNS